MDIIMFKNRKIKNDNAKNNNGNNNFNNLNEIPTICTLLTSVFLCININATIKEHLLVWKFKDEEEVMDDLMRIVFWRLFNLAK